MKHHFSPYLIQKPTEWEQLGFSESLYSFLRFCILVTNLAHSRGSVKAAAGQILPAILRRPPFANLACTNPKLGGLSTVAEN